MRYTWTDWQSLDRDACAAESASDRAGTTPSGTALRAHADSLRLAADTVLDALRAEAAQAEQDRQHP
jgi:hypothetical protein